MTKQIKNQFLEYFKADFIHHQPALVTLVYAPTSTGWNRTIETLKWVGMESANNAQKDCVNF